MKRYFETGAFVAVLAAATALGILPSARRVAAAERVPGPEATTGASSSTSSRGSSQANYQADYHANYRVGSTESRANGTEDSDTRRDGDRQRDRRAAPSIDRYAPTPSGSPR